MGRLIDLTGQRFGRLTVISRFGVTTRGQHAKWVCRCDCGNQTIVSSSNLRGGGSLSCGCLRLERLVSHFEQTNPSYGLYHTRLYRIYSNIITRTENPASTSYRNYGGRGIKMCDEWRSSFKAFYDWAMACGYDDVLTIDRRDVNEGYSPQNCRWVSRMVQANNTRVNHIVEWEGECHTLAEWARIMLIPRNVIYKRLKRGWSVEEALTTPVKQNR